MEERLQHVALAKEKLGSEFSWLCDSMDNAAKHALGDRPNSEYVIDPEGQVVVKRDWSNPESLRSDLEDLVGPVESITRVSDLDMPRFQPVRGDVTGVVPRIQLQGGMQPLRIEPIEEADSEHPFYVKLRAEASQQVVRGGSGQVYLGFFLDPLYHVHWNNQVDAPSYSIEIPEGASITPATGKGPEVDVEADSDPREFMIDVEMGFEQGPLKLTFHYFACDNENTFCVPVSQSYLVYLERDQDGGSRRSAGRRPGPGPGGQPSRPTEPRQRPSREENNRRMLGLLENADRDKDGLITRDELPRRIAERILDRLDANDDGKIDAKELDVLRDD